MRQGVLHSGTCSPQETAPNTQGRVHRLRLQAVGHGELQVLVILGEIAVRGVGGRSLPNLRAPGPGGDRLLLLTTAQLQAQRQVIWDTIDCD